uniref:Histone 2A-domain-containing protein n=1 Tax=Marseillevirus LCMAC101 TaxID=2506602 RepID=A0A481YR42_9VIRU|nr:MAG: histone 2A-domain-containing protein [Marseillevirus LCMAC101]
MGLDANFEIYIRRVLKQVHPDAGISGSALASLNNLVKITIQKIMVAINRILLATGKKTINSRDVQDAIRLILPGEVRKHAISEGTKAVTKYNSSKLNASAGDKPTMKSTRAGLSFSVPRTQKLMMRMSSVQRKTGDAAVYITAVCEYLMAEVMELAGNAAKDQKRVRVTPRHIKIAIYNDEELCILYKDTVFAGGVLPDIDPKVLEKKGKKKAALKNTKNKNTKATKKATKKKSATKSAKKGKPGKKTN